MSELENNEQSLEEVASRLENIEGADISPGEVRFDHPITDGGSDEVPDPKPDMEKADGGNVNFPDGRKDDSDESSSSSGGISRRKVIAGMATTAAAGGVASEATGTTSFLEGAINYIFGNGNGNRAPANSTNTTTPDNNSTDLSTELETDNVENTEYGGSTPTVLTTSPGSRSETPTPTRTPTATATETPTVTPSPTPTPEPVEHPGMSEAGRTMYETIKYHAMLDDLDTSRTGFELYNWDNQREAMSDEEVEKVGKEYWTQEIDLLDWEDVKAGFYGIAQGSIVNIDDSVDTENIYQDLLDRGFSKTGEKVNGIEILEGHDFFGREDRESSIAVDTENNFLLYYNDEKDDEGSIVKPVKKGLEARFSERSILDSKTKNGEEYLGQLNSLVGETAKEKGSPFYTEGIIDFFVDQEYNFLDEYKQATNLPGLSRGEVNYGMGSVLQDKKPQEKVDVFRNKFSASKITNGFEKVQEYCTEMLHVEDYAQGRTSVSC